MLTETSYHLAIACYIGAAVLALLAMGWWLSRNWRPAWVSLVVLLGGVLLLTPAYPQEGVDTLAPALIVAAFQTLTDGFEAAEHAWRPLLLFGAAAVVASIVIGLLTRRKPVQPEEEAANEGAPG